MNTQVNRICPECRTDDCFYPMVAECKSCRQARQLFMDSSLYTEELTSDKGVKTRINVSPSMVFEQVIQPWKSLLNLLFLN